MEVKSSELKVNDSIEVAAPDSALTIVMDPRNPLKLGSYEFKLEVLDNAGNRSKAFVVDVIIRDGIAPIARISAPPDVLFGQSFTLSGAESRDEGGGSVAKYIWTLVH